MFDFQKKLKWLKGYIWNRKKMNFMQKINFIF